MTFPKMYNTDEAAELLDLSGETLKNFRASNTGPNFVRLGASVKYLEEDLLDWLKAQRQLPPIDGSKAASPAAINAAMQAGSAERREALAQRQQEMVDLDRADLGGEPDPYALTMGVAGQPAGAKIERHFNVPPIPFSNAPAPHIIKDR